MAIKKVFHNKKNSGGGECQRVLGGQAELARAAHAWDEYADLLQLISASELINFCTDELDFDTKQVKAFKAGLSAIPAFLATAAAEVAELKNKAKKSQQEKEKK